MINTKKRIMKSSNAFIKGMFPQNKKIRETTTVGKISINCRLEKMAKMSFSSPVMSIGTMISFMCISPFLPVRVKEGGVYHPQN